MDFGLNRNSVVLLENLRSDHKLPVGTDVVWTAQKPYSSKLLGYILLFCYVAGEIAFMLVLPIYFKSFGRRYMFMLNFVLGTLRLVS